MKMLSTYHRIRAMTAIEVIMIIAALLMIAAVLLPQWARSHARPKRISCVNLLKQQGLAFKIWAGDHNDLFPMQVSTHDGGTMEFVGKATETFRHFEVISNELSTPKILVCPSETDVRKRQASTFVAGGGGIPFTGNRNLSYFVGVDAADTNAASFLCGDRNITNGFSINNGLLELKTNQLAGWTSEIHNQAGNIGLADGSVQQVTSQGLRNLLNETGAQTTRLAMP